MSILLGHFLEEVYEEPFRFKPERFLEQDKFVPKTFGFLAVDLTSVWEEITA